MLYSLDYFYYNKNGGTNFSVDVAADFFRAITTACALCTLFLMSLGWTLLRDQLAYKEYRFVSSCIYAYLFFALISAGCTDEASVRNLFNFFLLLLLFLIIFFCVDILSIPVLGLFCDTEFNFAGHHHFNEFYGHAAARHAYPYPLGTFHPAAVCKMQTVPNVPLGIHHLPAPAYSLPPHLSHNLVLERGLGRHHTK
ncbi:hypothetical protein EON65_00040 [archaeon]|nr:MAG: hypothetical protein EON65_00040 [archaeon]